MDVYFILTLAPRVVSTSKVYVAQTNEPPPTDSSYMMVLRTIDTLLLHHGLDNAQEPRVVALTLEHPNMYFLVDQRIHNE